jgi:hypothetical protein
LLEVAVLAAVLADGLAADIADWGDRVPSRGGNELTDFRGGDGRVDSVVWERVGSDEGPVGQDEGVKGEEGLLDMHLDGCVIVVWFVGKRIGRTRSRVCARRCLVGKRKEGEKRRKRSIFIIFSETLAIYIITGGR